MKAALQCVSFVLWQASFSRGASMVLGAFMELMVLGVVSCCLDWASLHYFVLENAHSATPPHARQPHGNSYWALHTRDAIIQPEIQVPFHPFSRDAP